MTILKEMLDCLPKSMATKSKITFVVGEDITNEIITEAKQLGYSIEVNKLIMANRIILCNKEVAKKMKKSSEKFKGEQNFN